MSVYNNNNGSVNGDEDDDIIYVSNSGSVTVTGGKGNDSLNINGSEAVVEYAKGEGLDTIYGFEANDTLLLTTGKVSGSVLVDNNLILAVGTGSITVQGAATLQTFNLIESATDNIAEINRTERKKSKARARSTRLSTTATE